MRRVVHTAFLAGAAVCAAAALAAPAPQLSDPKGDWSVATQDVTSGRLSTVRAGGTLALRGELTVAAAPAQGVPTTYGFVFGAGCGTYAFGYDWRGTAEVSEAWVQESVGCDAPVTTKHPATYALHGTTLTWQAAFPTGVRRGTRIRGFAGVACATTVCGAGVGMFDPTHPTVALGDLAYTDRTYVVGSDVSRR